MKIILITAMDPSGLIGQNGRLPWQDKEEMSFFRSQTLGESVIMGRKTFESMQRKPLGRRLNLVMSRDSELQYPGVTMVRSMEQALSYKFDKLFVIGGTEIYSRFLPYADEIIFSVMRKHVDRFTGGDYQFFPNHHLLMEGEEMPADKIFEGKNFVTYLKKISAEETHEK